MSLNKIFCLTIISLSGLLALSLEDLMVEGVKPSFDCAKAKGDDEKFICESGFGAGFNGLPIIDNFYTSYYERVMKNIEPQDKAKLKNISLSMLKNRKKCPSTIHLHNAFSQEAFEKQNQKDIANGYDAIDLQNLSSGLATTLGMNCYEYHYLKAFRQITEFIYNSPQYKVIFENIFYPNPAEYYQLIMTQKHNLPSVLRDYDAETIEDIIDKATRDHLIDHSGKLIIKVDSQIDSKGLVVKGGDIKAL